MKKKILSIMLTLSMLAMFMPCIASAETYGDFEYERNGSGITITKFTGDCYSGDRNVVIPAEIDGLPVTSIGNHAFDCEDWMENITIPDNVTIIGNYAFHDCKRLKNVTIPNNVTSIGEHAFHGCEDLKNITIPGSVKEIGKYAFTSCYLLEDVTILDGVTTISDIMFDDCKNLKNITIPDSVTSIGVDAFANCAALTSITIPDSVTNIGEYAFQGCISLTDVTIPDGVTTIGKSTFSYCSSLKNVIIPNGVTTIGNDAFNHCDALTNVNIPDSVTTIGEGAFDFPVDVPNAPTPTATPEPTPAPTAAPTEAPATQPTTAPQTDSFTDVPETHWAYDNIMRITELGGFNGYEDGTFKPDNQITHEEFLTVVMKLTYKGDVNDAPASTLSANWADWAKATLNAAVDAGIVTADDADLLAVNTPITRAEMAKVISRTLDYLGKAKAANPDTSKITDWNYVAEAYRPYVADAYSTGIITGYSDGSFGPARSLTRAEASAVIIRMIDAK